MEISGDSPGTGSFEKLKTIWIEASKEESPSPTELQDVFLFPEFGERVVQAIEDTDKAINATPVNKDEHYDSHVDRLNNVSSSREYGFGVFDDGGRIVVTPTFMGDEDSINIIGKLQDFRNKQDLIASRLLAAVHTHPSNKSAKMLNYIINGKSRDKRVGAAMDFFSIGDLKGFRQSADFEPWFIEGLAVKSATGNEGKVVLVSFRGYESLINFDPESVEEHSMRLWVDGKDYLDAYRVAGLNVGVLSVKLGARNPISRADAQNASQSLTRRVY